MTPRISTTSPSAQCACKRTAISGVTPFGTLAATIVETWIGMAGTVAEWNLPTIALAAIGTLATMGFVVLLVRQMRRGPRDPHVTIDQRNEGGVRGDN